MASLLSPVDKNRSDKGLTGSRLRAAVVLNLNETTCSSGRLRVSAGGKPALGTGLVADFVWVAGASGWQAAVPSSELNKIALRQKGE